MEKLKCSSCGAELQVEENKEYAVCNHCGTRYKLNEDLNLNIKLDDNMKEVLNTGMGTFNRVSKFMLIPIIFFVIFFVIIFIFVFINSRQMIVEEQSKIQDQTQQQEELADKQQRYSFNFQFINDNGTKSAFFLEGILDDIIQSNKTHDRQVVLVYNGTEITGESEIIDIKHSLNGKYEVSLNYDSDGYINKIVVDEIN